MVEIRVNNDFSALKYVLCARNLQKKSKNVGMRDINKTPSLLRNRVLGEPSHGANPFSIKPKKYSPLGIFSWLGWG